MKKLIALLLMLALVLSFAACGGDENGKDTDEREETEEETETEKPVTESDIKDAVFGAVTFTDELAPIEADIASLLYPCSDPEKIYAYCGSGALAEELVIVKTSDASLIDEFKAYRDKQIDVFEEYNMNEVEKLNECYIGFVGRFLVYCVSPDAEAVNEALSSLTK